MVFASDAMFTRDKPYELKGWSIYGADDDIDTTPQLITELDTTYAQLAVEDKIEVLSASASDITQTITIKGIDNSGNQVTEVIALNTSNGTTAVTSTAIFRYIDQVSVSASCVGVITVRRATGDTFIISIPVGALEATVIQHFNGEKYTTLTNWRASVTSTTGTVLFQLRWYPDDSKCLSATFATSDSVVLDEISLTNALDTVDRELNIKLSPGGWIAVVATGGSDNADGSITLQGFDTVN
ncbi:MAG: hypothetical protein ABIG52_00060 [Nanoarchaeota archaeon]